jgi:hypothetical protein
VSSFDRPYLLAELDRLHEDLDKQIKAVEELAVSQQINKYAMRNMNGDFMLAPLLVAKAGVLASKASLQ